MSVSPELARRMSSFVRDLQSHQDLIAWQIAEFEDVRAKAMEAFENESEEVQRELRERFEGDEKLIESQVAFNYSYNLFENDEYLDKISGALEDIVAKHISDADVNEYFAEHVPYGKVITRFISLESA